MKIAIVIDGLFRGGAERQALYAAQGLACKGCDVELICYHKVDYPYDHSEIQPARATFLLKQGRPLRFLWRLRNHLKRGGFDIVHAFKGSPSVYASLASRMAGIPVALAGFRVEYKLKGINNLVYRIVKRICTGWIVNSQAIVDSMVENIGAKRDNFYVLYNGIDQKKFVSEFTAAEAKERIRIPPELQTVSIVARLYPQKNHRLFLEMAAQVLNDCPNTRFLIVGDGPLRSSLQDYARTLGIWDYVLFLGIRSDITDVLAATDISVLTSEFEGLANALVEAMCVGIPVISTNYPGVEELVTDGANGFIVPRGDARAMADKVCTLLNDAERRRQMGQEGKKAVEARFSINAMAEQLLAIYEEALRKKSRY